jgi:hypothetical protein
MCDVVVFILNNSMSWDILNYHLKKDFYKKELKLFKGLSY